MNDLIDFLLKQLPQGASLIKQIYTAAPAAIDTIRELTAWLQRTIQYLQQEVPLTTEQEAALDKLIDEMKDEPWWKPQGK